MAEPFTPLTLHRKSGRKRTCNQPRRPNHRPPPKASLKLFTRTLTHTPTFSICALYNCCTTSCTVQGHFLTGHRKHQVLFFLAKQEVSRYGISSAGMAAATGFWSARSRSEDLISYEYITPSWQPSSSSLLVSLRLRTVQHKQMRPLLTNPFPHRYNGQPRRVCRQSPPRTTRLAHPGRYS
jgi:hypothetical protein